MSEYQWYEVVTLDRPLSAKQMAELRAISTRAEITLTRFWNEYQRGDLKVDPAKRLARYFDAHRYLANWGTHRFMLRLPVGRVDARALRAYFPKGETAMLTRTGAHIVLDLVSDTEEPEEDERWEPASLAALTPLRASLLDGDLSVAYLASLLAVQLEEVDDDAPEPDVPAGLAAPSAPLAALAEFLRIDPDLLQAAAEGCRAERVEPAALRRWVSGLSVTEKDRWLVRALASTRTSCAGCGRCGSWPSCAGLRTRSAHGSLRCSTGTGARRPSVGGCRRAGSRGPANAGGTHQGGRWGRPETSRESCERPWLMGADAA